MERLNHSDDLTPEEQAIENMMDASRGESMKQSLGKFALMAAMMEGLGGNSTFSIPRQKHHKPADIPAEQFDENGTHHAPPKVGRNEPCPCGSGKKNKRCCNK